MTELTNQLHRHSKLKLAGIFLGIRFQGQKERFLQSFGVKQPPLINLEELTPPDSVIATRTEELAQKLMKPSVYQHSLRTYKFGVALACFADMKFDPELLYLASLLHDLALGDAELGKDDFELRGARGARKFLLEEQYNEERANMVHEAIALHTSVGDVHHTPEQKLIHAGAGVDVVGLHLHQVSPAVLSAVVQEHSRLNFAKEVTALLGAEAKAAPACHFAGHVELGFLQTARANPLDGLVHDYQAQTRVGEVAPDSER